MKDLNAKQNKPMKKSLRGNATGCNMLGIGNMSKCSQSGTVQCGPIHNRYISPIPSHGVVVQTRVFHHAFSAVQNQNNTFRSGGTPHLPRPISTRIHFPPPETAVVQSSDDDQNISGAASFTRGTASYTLSSPSPPGGSVDTADDDYFTSNPCDIKIRIPRKMRMTDSLGNLVFKKPSSSKQSKSKAAIPSSPPPPPKKRGGVVGAVRLDCRFARIGTLRRNITEPVTFTTEYIHIDDQVRLPASALTSCEQCFGESTASLYLKTTEWECHRLRLLLGMSRTLGGFWYDSKALSLGENYIILVCTTALSELVQSQLNKILAEIGRANSVVDFTRSLPFRAANLMQIRRESIATDLDASSSVPKCPRNVKVSKTFPYASGTPRPSDAFQQEFVNTILCPPVPHKRPGSSRPTPPQSPLYPCRSSQTPERCQWKVSEISSQYLRTQTPPPQLSPPTRIFDSNEDDDDDDDDDDDVVEAKDDLVVAIDDDVVEAFAGPVQRLILYPPPPARGSISVTNEDLHCLSQGEFLNDVIIDFYLKYLVLAELKEEDASRTHIFSSFFYKRLTQTEQGTSSGKEGLSAKRRRHRLVRTWTRNVDLFQKDFIFVPINKSAHWFLAVLCFPGLEDPQSVPDPSCCTPPSTSPGGPEAPPPSTPSALYLNIHSEDKLNEDEQQDSSEILSKPTTYKQPCILIMDSLGGHARNRVVKTLQEYLEVEWEERKGTQRSFSMRGSNPRVPQQNNYSDCGVYLLQYVESFFQNPPQTFQPPMDLGKWFPQTRMKTKRAEIRDLILRIQRQQ